MDTSDWPNTALDTERDLSVLVAVVPRLSDWDHIVHAGWYHIPLNKAPARLAVDRLAFYHPSCFSTSAHTVAYYADVRGYALQPRVALFPEQPDHPRANALYYRLSLGPVQPLPWPVPAAGLRRLSFIRTSWKRLLQAQDVVELWPHESLSTRLARELREPTARYHCTLAVA